MMKVNNTVYIIDNDEELVKSVCWLLESIGYDVISYTNANDFLNIIKIKHPGCLLLDIRMMGMSGLELQDILTSKQQLIPIIFMTGYADTSTAVRAMKGGAFDFLTKPINNQVLLDSINKAINHDLKQFNHNAQHQNIIGRFNCLTPRESEVMQYLISNQTNKEIARHLGISLNTVELHRSKIMKKINVKNIVDLVNLAWLAGLVDNSKLPQF